MTEVIAVCGLVVGCVLAVTCEADVDVDSDGPRDDAAEVTGVELSVGDCSWVCRTGERCVVMS